MASNTPRGRKLKEEHIAILINVKKDIIKCIKYHLLVQQKAWGRELICEIFYLCVATMHWLSFPVGSLGSGIGPHICVTCSGIMHIRLS